MKHKLMLLGMTFVGLSACGKILEIQEVESPNDKSEISSDLDGSSSDLETLVEAKSSEKVLLSLQFFPSSEVQKLSSPEDILKSSDVKVSSIETSSMIISSLEALSSSSVEFKDTILVDERDGETYNILKVGEQHWMAKSLNFGQFVDDERDPTFIQEGVVKFCYDNDERNCESDGGLYQWHTAMNLPPHCAITVCEHLIDPDYHQGLCPNGWHIPIESDWDLLAANMGDTLLIGAKLKANNNSEFYIWNQPEFNNGDNSGFAAYPVGFRYFRGGFADRGKDVHFWGTQEAVLQNDTLGREVFSRTLSSQNSKLHRESYFKVDGFPVRCLRD
ncbi:hypothetical protein OAA91_02145 [Fibrobacterales bacterium]|nr:hypothetical protein [Fibrobacterales bacterium]